MFNPNDLSSIGTFNFAHSYMGAARALSSQLWSEHETHPDSPEEFLFWHSIELFLKAFLLADGMTEQVLRVRTYGHNIQSLYQEASRRGLRLTVKDTEVLSYMPDKDSMLELRYLKFGVRTVPDLEEIEETCTNIYREVGAQLQQRGVAVRVY